jgi:acetyl-CoA acyltransferase
MRDVQIAGVGQTRFGKFLDTSVREMAENALRAALKDADLDATNIESVYFANALSGLITGQETIRGQVALRHTGLMGAPVFNVDNACASGSSALQLAWLAVASGQVDVALAIGSEKLTHVDKAVTFAAYAGGVDVGEREALRADVPTGHSVFMDIYAEKTRRYMERSGATPRDFALVSVKSRFAGSLNPYAQFREPTSVAEVLSSRMVSEPLTLPMCSPIADGAAAVVLVASARSSRRSVFIRSAALVSANADGKGTVAAARAAQRAI